MPVPASSPLSALGPLDRGGPCDSVPVPGMASWTKGELLPRPSCTGAGEGSWGVSIRSNEGAQKWSRESPVHSLPLICDSFLEVLGEGCFLQGATCAFSAQ